MSDDEEKDCPEPSYFKFWLLILVTFFFGWIVGTGLLDDIISKLIGYRSCC